MVARRCGHRAGVGVERAAERHAVRPAAGEALHQVAPADHGRQWVAVADGLAEGGDVRGHADDRLVAAERVAKARDDLVEDQERARPVAERPQALGIAGLEGDAADIVHQGLDQHGRDVVVVLVEQSLDGGEVVEGQDALSRPWLRARHRR